MTAGWIVLILLGWLIVATAIAPIVGRRLRRNRPPHK